jgi:transcriptional accessory protein Tex/SPT6
VLEQLKFPFDGQKRQEQRDAVIKVLEFMQVDKYEVPFLWAYRRDYFAKWLPDRDLLWRIAQLDEKWEELQRRKVCMYTYIHTHTHTHVKKQVLLKVHL